MTQNTVATRRALTAALTALVTAGAVVALVAAVFLLSGWRLFVVATPSMASAAPVGSLVLAAPQSEYHVGDVITFTVDGRVVTHRIHAEDGGVFTTKGDLNGSPDAWSLKKSDIIGEAAVILPGAGWVLRGVPWLVVGASLTEVLIRLIGFRSQWRWSARVLGWSLSVAAVSLWLRPWVGVQMLGFRPADSGPGVLMHLVNTGVFPVRAAETTFSAGQDVVVRATERVGSGAYSITPVPDVGVLGQLIIAAVCLLPLVLALLRRDARPSIAVADSSPRIVVRAARRGLIAVCVVVPIVLVTVLSVGATGAAFAAQVGGTGTAATNSAFTCRQAMSASDNQSMYGAFAMGQTLVEGGNERNLVAGSPNGIWAVKTTVSSSYGCVRDTPKASVTFDGATQCLSVPGQVTNPDTFSEEAWFRTSAKSSGRIMGFGSAAQSANDGSYDRLIYLDAAGRVVFGVYPDRTETISTSKSFADNQWHHVVATLSSAGMALYVDGELAATKPGVTVAQNFSGYWKIGCGKLLDWADGTTSGSKAYDGPSYFTGQLQYAAIYKTALRADEVRAHYLAGR